MAASSLRPVSFRAVALATLAVLLTGAGAQVEPALQVAVGTVEIGSGDPPTWHPAHGGEVLRPGDALRTGAGSRAEVETAAGTIRLYERSTLRIPASSDGSSSVDLDQGASIFDIRHRDDQRPFEVHTPHAVVMVKGTRFTVSDDDGGASVAVERGLVSVSDSAGAAREMLVHPGFGVSGGAGRAFTLDLMRQGDDAWESWTRGGLPERPALPVRESHAAAGVESARAAAHAVTSQQVAGLASNQSAADTKPGAAEPGHEGRGDGRAPAGSSAEPEVGRPPASALKTDGGLDRPGARPVKEAFGEALLGGSSAYDITVSTDGDFDRIHIVGTSGLDVTFSQSDLKQVISGNTALLGPQLLGALSSRGVSPRNFARQMLDLL